VSTCTELEVKGEKFDLVRMKGFRGVVPQADVAVISHSVTDARRFSKESDEILDNQW
jgi:hypothetical protein